MLVSRAVRPALPLLRGATSPQNAGRNMATLRELELRLKSVRNIEKITKSMKMIATTRLAKAQRAMTTAKAYGEANKEIFNNTPSEGPAKNKIFVVVSSDRGLCGGIHSSVSKATRRALVTEPEGNVVILGDKAKAQLSRTVAKNVVLSFNQIGRDIPSFADAAAIADGITSSGVEFDAVDLVYNKFVSALAFEAATMEVLNAKALKESPGFKAYEMEDDASTDLAEFALANAIYATLTEAHAAEISSRRNAMDNATKNANDMIGSLTMKYNRGRQAAITNELVDIITGASAL